MRSTSSRVKSSLFLAASATAIGILSPSAADAATLYAWGANAYGQLGRTENIGKNVANLPGLVVGLNDTVTAAAGGYHGGFALQNGAVYVWGEGTGGQYGMGNANAYTAPYAIPTLSSGVTAIAANGADAASAFGLAIKGGAAYAWGSNNAGQLGITADGAKHTPAQVPGLTSNVTAIAAGIGYGLAVQNGAVYAWGTNSTTGQLGIGVGNTTVYGPTQVSGLSSGVTAVTTGAVNTTTGFGLAIKEGGLYAWGTNTYGQLGNGNATAQTTPVAVANATNNVSLSSGVTAVSAGSYHTLAIKDGNVYAWGINTSGQLGNGTITGYSNKPVLALDKTADFTAVVASAGNGCFALSADGSLWVWGSNIYGQLSLDATTYTNVSTPQQIFAPTGYKFVAIASSIGSGGNDMFALVAVPEPASASSALLSLGGLMMWRRRRS